MASSQRLALLRTALAFDGASAVREIAAQAICDLALSRCICPHHLLLCCICDSMLLDAHALVCSYAALTQCHQDGTELSMSAEKDPLTSHSESPVQVLSLSHALWLWPGVGILLRAKHCHGRAQSRS